MDIYLNTAVKRLFNLWVSFAVFLILIVLLQTIFGKYGDGVNSAWLWLVLCLAPGILLIFYGYFRYKRVLIKLLEPDKLLFKLAFYLSVFYLAAVLLGLLLQPFSNPERSEAENLHATDPGLIFLQFLFFLSLGLFIYKTQKRSLQATDNLLNETLSSGESSVFISYSHVNKDAAGQLKALLEKEGIKVIIDYDTMQAGRDIRNYITESVRNSQVTLAIISKESLLSGWVSLETIDTFSLERFTSQKRFIACYLDEEFLKLNFTSQAVQSLNKNLEMINKLIDDHNELGIDTLDLNDEKSRIITLRNNLDNIIHRLRSSLCIDIREDKLRASFPLLLKSINNK